MRSKALLHRFYRRNPRLSTFLVILLLYLTFFYFGLKRDHVELENAADKRLERLMAPNQTRWLQLYQLPPRRINLTAPHVSSKAKMVIIVSLEPHMDTRRHEIRTSWAHPNNSHAIKDGLVSVLFVVNEHLFSELQIKTENEIYTDILVVGGQESFKGLVYKLLLVYKWITNYYPLVDVAKIDSDVVLDVDRLYRAVNKEIHHPRFAMGYLLEDQQPSRNPHDFRYIPKSAFSGETLPPYINGPLYVVSSDAVKAILLEAPHFRVFEAEDVLFTGRLAEAATVERIRLQGVYKAMPENQPCDGEGNPTIIGYPRHNTKIGLKLETQKLKTIRCGTLWDTFFG